MAGPKKQKKKCLGAQREKTRMTDGDAILWMAKRDVAVKEEVKRLLDEYTTDESDRAFLRERGWL